MPLTSVVLFLFSIQLHTWTVETIKLGKFKLKLYELNVILSLQKSSTYLE